MRGGYCNKEIQLTESRLTSAVTTVMSVTVSRVVVRVSFSMFHPRSRLEPPSVFSFPFLSRSHDRDKLIQLEEARIEIPLGNHGVVCLHGDPSLYQRLKLLFR
mmetsp:Transcript_68741/g.161621  ORF Transcript_68741/g.161621 Transcript_68741/m.161621 type:complete len:103 (-) Transcript_68741:542-850(-)